MVLRIGELMRRSKGLGLPVSKPTVPPPPKVAPEPPPEPIPPPEQPRETFPQEREAPRQDVANAIRLSEVSQEEVARDVYREAVALAEKVLQKVRLGGEVEGTEIQRMVEEIVREVVHGNVELLRLVCSQPEVGEITDILSAKLVNKTVLAVEIGHGKQIERPRLIQLGVAAFLSDVGIVEFLDLVSKKEIFTDQEKEKIRNLPYKTVEILKKIPDLNEVVLKVALESHERLDGSGPMGTQDLEKMDEFSRIVAVIDVFEALTHDRPHRPRILPHEAIKKILEEGGKYEESVLRLLIDRVGLYPVGTWVRLTTKEVAKVVAANPGQPFRPRVKVMFDERGRPLERSKVLDLNKLLTVQVLEPVSDDALKKFIQVVSSS